MKIVKLFIVFFLVMPLYLSAAEPATTTAQPTENATQDGTTTNNNQPTENATQDGTTTNNNQPTETADKKSEELIQEVPAEAPATTAEETATPADATSENASATPANPNIIPKEVMPEKSFNNSVEGSKEFIDNMLALVYSELPKKTNNQEIFNYLSALTSEYFAFTYMSKWTAGREVIKEVPAELQERYLGVSKEFMILLYGEIFNTYYKQYSYRLGEVVRKSDTQYEIKMRVESKAQDARNQDAILNVVWKIKYSDKEKKFFVIDIDVNGIVFLTTQKKQFSDMLKSTNNDFAKFVDLLEAKNVESKKRLGIVI